MVGSLEFRHSFAAMVTLRWSRIKTVTPFSSLMLTIALHLNPKASTPALAFVPPGDVPQFACFRVFFFGDI